MDYSESNTADDLEKYIEQVQREMESQQELVSWFSFSIKNSIVFYYKYVCIDLINSDPKFIFLFSFAPLVDVQMPVDAQINLKLQNILMLLKRCCNHAYLIEYPLVPGTQEFKVI